MIYRRRNNTRPDSTLVLNFKHLFLRTLSSAALSSFESCTNPQKTLANLGNTHIDVPTYASLLQICGSKNLLSEGREVHQHIMTKGHGAHASLTFPILEMYCKCGAAGDAASWFTEMPFRNVWACNQMMELYTQHGRSLEVMLLFNQMLQEGMLGDMLTYISIISVCTTLALLSEGKRIHVQIIGGGYESQIVMATSLVNFYSKCGVENYAVLLFDGMQDRGTITWNALISGYKKNKHCEKVLQLFDQMFMESVLPSKATFACTLAVCTSQVSLSQGKKMHVYVIHSGFELDLGVSNSLIRMYSRCSSLEDAQWLFDVLSGNNLLASKAMLTAFVQQGHLKDALKLMIRMQESGMEIEITSFMQLIDLCGNQGALAEGKHVHACIKQSSYGGNTVICNALISMYSKCHSLEDAQSVFDWMPHLDAVSWNAMIGAFSQNGYHKKASQLFDEMQQAGMMPNNITFVCVLDTISSQGDLLEAWRLHTRVQSSGLISNVVVATALANMYATNGSLEMALSAFDLIPEPNVVSWTAMISSHLCHGLDKDTMQLFNQMLQQGVIPDRVTYLNMICVCTNQAALNDGKVMHVLFKHCQSESDIVGANALVNMYSKCGFLCLARGVFDRMPIRDLETWNIMLAAYAQNGLGKEALLLLQKLQQGVLAPDKVTLVSYLSACSRTGYVDQAFSCLLQMDTGVLGVRPVLDHYDCIVDVLGRAGQLWQADHLIEAIPLQPSELLWMTLLTVSREVVDIGLVKKSAEHVVEIDPMLVRLQ